MRHLFLTIATVLVSLPWMVAANTKQLTNKEELLQELTGKDTAKMSDISLYAEIVGAYQAEDQHSFKNNMQTFMSRFPQSNYADNVLYLSGRMAMEHHNYALALKEFSRLVKEYPNGNKVVSAEFAKAQAYKKMNLPQLAKDVFLNIKKKYPGSPESYRADTELHILN